MSLLEFQEEPTCCSMFSGNVNSCTLEGYVREAVDRKYMDVESGVVVNRYTLKGHEYEFPCLLVKDVKHRYDQRCDMIILKYNMYGFFISHGLKELCARSLA